MKRVLAKFKQQTSVIRLVAVTSFALIYLAVWLKINYLQLESFSIYYYNLGINVSAFIQMAHTSSIRALFIEVDPQHPIYFLFMWITLIHISHNKKKATQKAPMIFVIEASTKNMPEIFLCLIKKYTAVR